MFLQLVRSLQVRQTGSFGFDMGPPLSLSLSATSQLSSDYRRQVDNHQVFLICQNDVVTSVLHYSIAHIFKHITI